MYALIFLKVDLDFTALGIAEPAQKNAARFPDGVVKYSKRD
jgi:hypothetical protein